jgi:hypothetical protein
MSCLRERVVVVLGDDRGSWRSGTEAAKRMIRCMSCSGRARAVVMVNATAISELSSRQGCTQNRIRWKMRLLEIV